MIILASLVPCRRFFYRKAALLGSSFTPAWTVAVVLVMACSAWLIIFSYKHVEYSHDLWWNFTLYGHASRSLRALVGATGVAPRRFSGQSAPPWSGIVLVNQAGRDGACQGHRS